MKKVVLIFLIMGTFLSGDSASPSKKNPRGLAKEKQEFKQSLDDLSTSMSRLDSLYNK